MIWYMSLEWVNNPIFYLHKKQEAQTAKVLQLFAVKQPEAEEPDKPDEEDEKNAGKQSHI